MNERTYNMYLKLAKYLGIELVFADYCNELEEAEDQLYYSMEEGLPDEFDEIEVADEEKEYMTELINSADIFFSLKILIWLHCIMRRHLCLLKFPKISFLF